jgi:hypothetical protein
MCVAICLVLSFTAVAPAQQVTPQTLVDRQQILDLITRYQGKEYGTFVKVKGQWRYKTGQIAGGSEPPAGWKE